MGFLIGIIDVIVQVDIAIACPLHLLVVVLMLTVPALRGSGYVSMPWVNRGGGSCCIKPSLLCLAALLARLAKICGDRLSRLLHAI